MIEISALKLKLNGISKNIPKNQWKYFNKHTIENFICALNSIEDNFQISEVANTLDNYLDDVRENFEAHIDYAIYIYETYLKPLLPIYQNQLGFVVVPSKGALILIVFILIIVSLFLSRYKYFEFLFLIITISFSIRDIIKYYNRKVYGLGF